MCNMLTFSLFEAAVLKIAYSPGFAWGFSDDAS